jgi:hypothetical protein
MKTIRLFLSFVSLAIVFVGCGKEDALEADFKNPSANFMPDENDQSEEAQLRRQFFKETGSYLLFNDTIQRELLGVDINGKERYFIETIDLNYAVGQTGTTNAYYNFTLLQTQEQKQLVTDFVRTYVLNHLTGKLRPYSWFLCNVINSYKDNYSAPSKPYSATNQRCIAVAGNYLIQRDRTDDQKKQYAQRVLNGVVGQLVTNNSSAFEEFFKYSANYYSADYSRFGYDGRPSQTELYRLGFLSSTSISAFPSMSTDLGVYALQVIQYTDEQLQQQYGNYPVIIEKAAVVRRVMTELGYVF